MSYDIVYILKNDIDDAELIYSVRSVCKNFNYNSIWFTGGTPQHIKPDHHVPINQEGHNRWLKVTNTIKTICKNRDITDNFWLFNDDFFIMKPTDNLLPMIDGTIARRIKEIQNRNPGQMSVYAQQLYIAEKSLQENDLDTLNYALHVPMLINKNKAIETINKFPNSPMFRSLYGNYNKIGGIVQKDVKIYTTDDIPDEDAELLSTSDLSFHSGKVGEFIRERFPNKCKYET